MNYTTLFQAEHRQDRYEEFLQDIRAEFNASIHNNGALFTTDAADLFEVFISGFPPQVQQHYVCDACYKFVEKFGGVVTINSNGYTSSAIWPRLVPPLYSQSVDNAKRIVENSKVTGVFFAVGQEWGKPRTGEWRHMSVTSGVAEFSHAIKSAGQMMAEKREDYKLLHKALKQYPLEAVRQASAITRTDALYRSEKVSGIISWFEGVHKATKTKNKRTRDNLIWLAVATAPAGFCHIKQSMIGTLLDDIIAGFSFETISRRFYDKMHPLQYQRPQVAPTVGNIAQAEKVIKRFDAAGSLDRRFARIDEVKLIWKPVEQRERPVRDSEGVFGHLKSKGAYEVRNLDIPPVTMTWSKFEQTVLQSAEAIEFYVPSRRDSYTALVTAVNYNAPPILQWDSKAQRNPVSWYLYHNGSLPSDWGLTPGFHTVTGISFKPSMWYGNFSHYGQGVVFILDGAKDGRYESSGNALFTETLKREFREIRATIEAYSRNAVLQGYDEASACGIALSSGDSWSAVFRVLSDGQKTHYKLDRWD
jgi:hypothetical protein